MAVLVGEGDDVSPGVVSTTASGKGVLMQLANSISAESKSIVFTGTVP